MAEQLVKALGRLTLTFADLEDHVKDIVCALLSDDKRTGEIVTCRMAFNSLCDLTAALFRHKVKEKGLLDFFDELMPQVRHCGEGRNAYIHSTWYTRDRSIPYIRAKPRLKKGKNAAQDPYCDYWQTMGCGDINDLSDLIEETGTGAFELLLHMQSMGLTRQLQIPGSLPRMSVRHFKARKELTRPWEGNI